ncbi:MAG: hypothetical protein WAN65_13065 [Candidatus Sulfotelmatobacter sp.]
MTANLPSASESSRWFRYLAITLVCVGIVAAVAGVLYQTLSSTYEAALTPCRAK